MAGVEGVAAAQVAMATDLNVEVIRRMGFDVPDAAGPNDLVVAVRAEGEEALAAADAVLAQELAGGRRAAADGRPTEAVPPRTVGSATAAPAATLALVSLPGRYAFAEALDALKAGLDVMLFSDNVPVAQEVLLKDRCRRARAARHGRHRLRHRRGGPASGWD